MFIINPSLVFEFLETFLSELSHECFYSSVDGGINQVGHSFSHVMWNLIELWIIFSQSLSLNLFILTALRFFMSDLGACFAEILSLISKSLILKISLHFVFQVWLES